MDQRTAERLAAELLRVIVGYDGRDDIDQFAVTAFASGMKRNPHLEREDWYQGIEDWYMRPQAGRIRVGDLVHAAKAARTHRLGGNRLAVEAGRTYAPRPANWDEMVSGMQAIVRQFRAEGADPTDEDVLREWARRQPHART